MTTPPIPRGADHATIRLSDTLSLPAIEYASQGNAILGIRDSGKSYTATYLAEALLTANIPIVAFDPIGVWKFLRVPKDPAGQGFPIVIAKPQGGDVTLAAASAAELMRAAMREKVSLVLDLYSLGLSKADWRRIVHECVSVLLYENGEHGLRHIFLEEAAEFVPQKIGPEQAKVYGTLESLARMGGNALLGYTLINQRAEEVNKAVLELCDCLFLHRQKGKRSLESLSKWLSFSGISARDIIGMISTAATGECWVWPRSTETPIHVPKIPAKLTFQPDRRAVTGAAKVQLPPLDSALLERLQKALEVEPTEEEETMKSLRFDVKRLKAIIAAAETKEAQKVPVFRVGDLAKLEELTARAREIAGNLATVADRLEVDLRSAHALSEGKTLQLEEPAGEPAAAPIPNQAPPKPPHRAMTGDLSTGARRLLITANQHYPRRLTQVQLGTLAGLKPSSVRTYIPELNSRGYLSKSGDEWVIGPAGRAIVQDVTPPKPKGATGLLELWMSKLDAGPAKIFREIYATGSRGFTTQEALSEATGYTASSLRTYLPTLRNNNLIEKNSLRVTAEFLA